MCLAAGLRLLEVLSPKNHGAKPNLRLQPPNSTGFPMPPASLGDVKYGPVL